MVKAGFQPAFLTCPNPAKRPCCKGFRASAVPIVDEIRNAPKPGAIPTSLYPDIQFLPLYHGGGENQRFSCLWSFMWSKPLLCRFRQSGEIPQTQVSQGFAAFRLAPFRIPPRHSQSRRATNCATPGYSVFYPAGRILPNQLWYSSGPSRDTKEYFQEITCPTVRV